MDQQRTELPCPSPRRRVTHLFRSAPPTPTPRFSVSLRDLVQTGREADRFPESARALAILFPFRPCFSSVNHFIPAGECARAHAFAGYSHCLGRCEFSLACCESLERLLPGREERPSTSSSFTRSKAWSISICTARIRKRHGSGSWTPGRKCGVAAGCV